MFEGIKGIISSKKFWITIIGAASIAALGQIHASPEVIAAVAGLFGVNVGAQGYADGSKK